MLKTIRPQQSDGLQYTPVSGRYRCKPMYIGSPTRARTWDLRINSPSLYQLSYRGNDADEALNYSFFRVNE
jgi:hypothetical protein